MNTKHPTNHRVIFYLSFTFALLYRVTFVHEIQTQNFVPKEIDDSLSYILHGAFLVEDPAMNSPALNSFKDLKNIDPSKSWYDWTVNRHYHRIKYFYHQGHALLVAGLKHLFGVDYFTSWWILTYLFNFILLAGVGLFVRRTYSSLAASACLIVFAPSLTFFSHQFTAAPREWSIVCFLLSLVQYVRIRDKKTKLVSTSFNILSLFLLLFMTCSAHTIGKLMIFLFLLIIFSDFVLQKVRSFHAISIGALSALTSIIFNFLLIKTVAFSRRNSIGASQTTPDWLLVFFVSPTLV